MIRVSGVERTIRNFNSLAGSARREVMELTERTGRNIEGDAAIASPVDTGYNRGQITYEPVLGGFGAKITANATYAAILEFGTGGSVSIPPGFEDLADQYRGKGERTINLPARPFLIPAYLKHRDLYYQELKRILSRL